MTEKILKKIHHLYFEKQKSLLYLHSQFETSS